MADRGLIGQTLESVNDRALLQVMGVGQDGKRIQQALRRQSRRKNHKHKHGERTYIEADHAEAFGFVQWQPDALSEESQHQFTKRKEKESITLRHVSRAPEVVVEDDHADLKSYTGAFRALALAEDRVLGLQTTQPPGRVFVISTKQGSWATLSRIRVGCEIIRVNGEFIEYVSTDSFRQAFQTRRLELTLLPPSHLAPVLQVNVARDEHGDLGFRVTRSPLSIAIVEPSRQAELPSMSPHDLILGVNGSPVHTFEHYRKASRALAEFTLILRRPSGYEIPSHESGGTFKIRAKRDASGKLGFFVVGLPLAIAHIRPDYKSRLHPMQVNDQILAVNDNPLVSYSRYELATAGRDVFVLTLRHAQEDEVGLRTPGSTYAVDIFRNDDRIFGFNVDFPVPTIGRIQKEWQSILYPMRERDLITAVNGTEVDTRSTYLDAIVGLRGFTLTLQSYQFDVMVKRDISGDTGFSVGHPPLSVSHVKPSRAAALHPLRVDDLILAVNGEIVSDLRSYRDMVAGKKIFIVTLLHEDEKQTRTKKRESGDLFDVTVEVNQFEDGGFSLDYPPLAVVNVQNFVMHPAQHSDVIVAVDGRHVVTKEDYRKCVSGLEEFTLTLKRPQRADLVSMHSFDVEIIRDDAGNTGFEIAHPPLSIGKLSDEAKMLYTIRKGDRILAVDGQQLMFPAEYEQRIYGCDAFVLTVLRPQDLGEAPIPDAARTELVADKRSDGEVLVKIKRDAQGCIGFSVDPQSLEVTYVENPDVVFPMKVGDLICSVNGSHVTTHAEFMYMTECLEVFSLMLREPASSGEFGSDVQVNIVGAKNLGDPEGSCSPFCVCQVEGVPDLKFKTHVVRADRNPVWDYTKLVTKYPNPASLVFSLFNQDDNGSEFWGKSSLQFTQFHPGGFEGELLLQDASSDSHSVLLVRVGPCALKSPLRVTIVRAKGLRDADTFGSSDPYCVCEVRGKKQLTFETYVEADTLDPTWNHLHEIMDICVGDILDFTVLDSDVSKTTDLLGWVSLRWEDLSFDGLEHDFLLQDAGPDVGTTLTLKLEQIKPIPLEITIASASEIRRSDIIGGADPYCVCEVLDPHLESGQLRFQTPVSKDTLSPVWNFVSTFREFPPSSSLKFSLWDKDASGSDSLGSVILANTSIIPNGFAGNLTLLCQNSKSAVLSVTVEVIAARPKPKPKRKRPESRLKEKSFSRLQDDNGDDLYRGCYLERAFGISANAHAKPWQSREAAQTYTRSKKAWDLEDEQEKVIHNIATGGDLTLGRILEMHVFDIRYSCDSIENRFHDGSELFLESLHRFPLLKVAAHKGIHYALNNQHLYVLKTARPQGKVKVQLAKPNVDWTAKWPPSTESRGVQVSIKQESTLQHVCFGNGPKEWLVVSRLKCGKQQFRHEGVPQELAWRLQSLYTAGYDVSVVGFGTRGQWFVAGQSIDKRDLQMFWGGLPDNFATDLKSCRGKILGASFAHDGWLLHAELNSVWRNVPRRVEKLLNSIHGGQRHLTHAALGPNGEFFMASASDSKESDHQLHWGGMGIEFDKAMQGDVECVSLGGPNVFVTWSGDYATSWGVDHHLLNCPEFN